MLLPIFEFDALTLINLAEAFCSKQRFKCIWEFEEQFHRSYRDR